LALSISPNEPISHFISLVSRGEDTPLQKDDVSASAVG